MCWPGLPGKGVACHCFQQKCSRRCLWSRAGALDGAQDHPSQPEALAGMATSHQHWASLSPVPLAQWPPHFCAPPVCRMELGRMGGHGADTAGTRQGLLTCGESRNALGLWTSFPWTPSLAAPCLLLSCKVGTKACPGLGPPWAHWKAQNKVCKPHLKQKLQC